MCVDWYTSITEGVDVCGCRWWVMWMRVCLECVMSWGFTSLRRSQNSTLDHCCVLYLADSLDLSQVTHYTEYSLYWILAHWMLISPSHWVLTTLNTHCIEYSLHWILTALNTHCIEYSLQWVVTVVNTHWLTTHCIEYSLHWILTVLNTHSLKIDFTESLSTHDTEYSLYWVLTALNTYCTEYSLHWLLTHWILTALSTHFCE